MRKLKVVSNVQAKLMMVNSATMSQMPRVNKYHESWLILVLFDPYRNAEVPVRKTKTGAQKCVIQRVKNSRGVVVERFVGSEYQVPKAKYMRTCYRAIMIITTPRSKSMDAIL